MTEKEILDGQTYELYKLFEKDIFLLPKENVKNISVREYMASLLKEYLDEVKALVDVLITTEESKLIEKFSFNLLNAFNKGIADREQGYRMFCEAVFQVEDRILSSLNKNEQNVEKVIKNDKHQNLIIGKVTPFNNPYTYENRNFLFRARNVLVTKPEELFHVPFEKKDYASEGRFSLNGSPCIYLGSSLYGCLKELKMQDPEELLNYSFSRYEILNDLSVINLAIDFKTELLDTELSYKFFNEAVIEKSLKIIGIECFEKIFKLSLFTDYYKEEELGGLFNGKKDINQFIRTLLKMKEKLINMLITFPLAILCSIKRSSYGKEEYIIPQYCIRWVKDSFNVDGIIYFSTKIESEVIKNSVNMDRRLLINYAFPVKKISENGYCEYLKEKFALTSPFNIHIYGKNNPLDKKYNGLKNEAYTREGQVKIMDEYRQYPSHLLKVIEGYLFSLEAHKL